MFSVVYPGMPRIKSSSAEGHDFQARVELHPPQLSVILLPYFPIILLNIILYVPLILLSTFPKFTASIWNLRPAWWDITIHRRMRKYTLAGHLHMHSRWQPIFITHQLFKLPTKHSSIALEIVNVFHIILIKQDHDETDRWEISHDPCEDPR